MSKLNELTLSELHSERIKLINNIDFLKYQAKCKSKYLKRIEDTIHKRTPQELTWDEIERKFGHKVIVK